MNKFYGQDAFDLYVQMARLTAEDEAIRACKVTCEELAAKVKKSVPVGDPRAGHIKDSVQVFRKDRMTYGVRIGSEATPYAAALEFGHAAPDGSRVPAQKVFFPHVRVINKKHGRRMRRWFRKALKDTGV